MIKSFKGNVTDAVPAVAVKRLEITEDRLDSAVDAEELEVERLAVEDTETLVACLSASAKDCGLAGVRNDCCRASCPRDGRSTKFDPNVLNCRTFIDDIANLGREVKEAQVLRALFAVALEGEKGHTVRISGS